MGSFTGDVLERNGQTDKCTYKQRERERELVLKVFIHIVYTHLHENVSVFFFFMYVYFIANQFIRAPLCGHPLVISVSVLLGHLFGAYRLFPWPNLAHTSPAECL